MTLNIFAYVSIGEVVGWIIGWDLTLEYMIGGAAVARGWSGLVDKLVSAFLLILNVDTWWNFSRLFIHQYRGGFIRSL